MANFHMLRIPFAVSVYFTAGAAGCGDSTEPMTTTGGETESGSDTDGSGDGTANDGSTGGGTMTGGSPTGTASSGTAANGREEAAPAQAEAREPGDDRDE